jgi:hypothetical protein
LPKGEPDSFIRWELEEKEENNTILSLTFSRLTKPTGLDFAPGLHSFLDRLEALLNKELLPDWMKRYAQVKGSNSSWQDN